MKVISVFNNYMPETGGYQSAKQMYSLTEELFGEDNVSMIFLAMPKRSFKRIISFLRVLKEERALIAEGFIQLNIKTGRLGYWYKFFSLFNYFGILKIRKLLGQADVIIITGFLELSIVDMIRSEAKNCHLFFNHAGDPFFFNSLITSYDKEITWDSYLKYMNKFSKILFQSELQLNFAKKIGVDPTRCFDLIPTCNEQSISDQLQGVSNPFQPRFFNIVTIGTLQERKNQELVVELASTMTNLPFRFYLIGDERVSMSYTKKIKKMIKDRNLTNIFILGHRSDYIVFVKYCDVLLNVSKSEGVSRVLRESLFLGKILVCTKIFGNMDCVIDQENGFLCDYNVSDIKEKVCYIKNLTLNDKLRLQTYSKWLYEKKYSLDGYRNNLKKLYSSI
jgi:glycosyltransferase involved in cell wall biosynthesis